MSSRHSGGAPVLLASSLLAVLACGSFGSEAVQPGVTGDGGGAAVEAGADATPNPPGSDAGGDAGCLACDRFVFVLTQQVVGDFGVGGLEEADTRCNTQGNAAGSLVAGRSYRAWLSTDEVSAADRFVHGTGPYKLPKGELVAASFGALLTSPLAHAIDQYADGVTTEDLAIWTGTLADGGRAAGLTCRGWTTRDAGGGRGSTAEVNQGEWSFIGVDDCAQDHSIYCVEN